MRRIVLLTVLALFGIAVLFQHGYSLSDLPQAPVTQSFINVSWQAGIRDNRVASTEQAIGQAWGDYDNDGWLDLYVTDPKGPNTLYRNNGDGTFSRSTLAELVSLPQAHSSGATFVDFDNDGWRDLFVANWGMNNLFQNRSGERFVDVTKQAGLTYEANHKAGSWGDFNADGFVDLYVTNWSCYPQCGRPMEGDADRLYQNDGNGTFTDVTHYLTSGIKGAGFVASFNDYDNDGDLDIYLVNDEYINGVGNMLWRNDGAGCQGWCFTQVAQEAGANSKLFGMGLAVGDYDNDQDLDYYFSNVGPMELLQNQGDGSFLNVAAQAGVEVPAGIGWGAAFLDYDNDGWQDLYLALMDTTNHEGIAANPLFHNNADGTFTQISCGNEAADVRPSMGVAYADYDQDGWVDLVVGNMDEGYRLYRNLTGDQSTNYWLALELVGGGPVNRDAIGVRVYLTTPDGITQMQEVINGSNLGAGSELALNFGLGKASRADLTIRWPDGRTQKFENVAANQRYHLEYPSSEDTLLQPISRTPETALVADFNWDGEVQPNSYLLVAILGLSLLSLGLLGLKASAPGQAMVMGAAGGLLLVVSFVFSLQGAGFLQDTDGQLQALMAKADVRPPTMPEASSPELVRLGEALFWDPELGGNRDTACVTCHHPLLGTGDNLSVPIGTGGAGLGETRLHDPSRDFVPRNAPPLYNLGYLEWTVMFWDGRVSGSLDAGFDSPVSDRLPAGLDSVLAVQAMFPVTSREEMRGRLGDKDAAGQKNELAVIQDYKTSQIWPTLIKRLLAIPGYVELFTAAYPDIPDEKLGFQHAANALAAYQIQAFTFEDSPFDRYLKGEQDALSPEAKQGGLLFFGKAGCSSCHSGGLLTDQRFHNMAVPQVGPGKGRDQPLDYGRARETGSACDLFAFRTPPLRNVAITGPWMHNGAYTTLEAAVHHQLQAAASLKNYDASQLSVLIKDTCQDQPEVIAAIMATAEEYALSGVQLTPEEFSQLMAFLEALTSPSALDLEHIIPASVPSGLPVGGNIRTSTSSQDQDRILVTQP